MLTIETVTVTAVKVTTAVDDLGDETETRTEHTIDGCLFEPQQATERSDNRSPGVVVPAKVYLPVALQLDADDLVRIGGPDGTPWQVVARAAVWGDQTEVPIREVTDV